MPEYANPDPVRVVFLDGDKAIVSDEFTVGREINKDFAMSLYTGTAGDIQASYKGKTYTVNMGMGTLSVLGTTDQVKVNPVAQEAPADGAPGAAAETGTKYTINNSEVEVKDSTGVSLLFDEIINHEGSDRTDQLQDRAANYLQEVGQSPSSGKRFAYELKYLDLVDAHNGNAWVTADKDLTVYWPLPDGAGTGTVRVLHFVDLHRDMTTGQIEDSIPDSTVEPIAAQVTENGQYVTFSVGSGGFSPFALVWEENISHGSDGGHTGGSDDDKEDDDSDRPSDPSDTGVSGWLDTDDHRAYLTGYPGGLFEPDNSMTRAEVAQMFYALLNDKSVTITRSIPDVP